MQKWLVLRRNHGRQEGEEVRTNCLLGRHSRGGLSAPHFVYWQRRDVSGRKAGATGGDRANSRAVAIETESRAPLRTREVLRRKNLPFQARIVVLALAGGLPALIAAFILLRGAPIADSVLRLIVLVLLGVWVGFALAVRHAAVEPMRSIANLLEALRGGDYGIRGRHARKGDALGDIVLEANRLGATLRSQRFEALEASARSG